MANDLLSVKPNDPPFAPAKAKARLVDDKELAAMHEIDQLLRDLDPRARERALGWLAHRYGFASCQFPRDQQEGA